MPRVICTGQAIVDLVMRIPALPARGGDIFASDSAFQAGGSGFNMMAAAARLDAQVIFAGAIGNGPFAQIVRTGLAAEGIAEPLPAAAKRDTGFCIALVDDDAERTFVTVIGAEADVDAELYQRAGAAAGDIVYVSGYSFMHPANRDALVAWLPSLPDSVLVVFDPAPVVADIDDSALAVLRDRVDIWTANQQEAAILAGRDGEAAELASELARQLNAVAVVRAGADGAYLASASAPVQHFSAPPVVAVDTNGAGDAHVGAMCAQLAQGAQLDQAVCVATLAAGLAVTKPGPATSPTRAELAASTTAR